MFGLRIDDVRLRIGEIVKLFILIGLLVGVASSGVAVGIWYYSGSEERAKVYAELLAKAAKMERYKLEEKPYRLTVVSYVYSRSGGGARSIPVMVKMVVTGSKRLRTVCARMPHVKEAVLRTLTPAGASLGKGGGRLDLAGFETHLRQEINKVTAANTVKSLHAVMLASGGASGSNSTRRLCADAFKS